jgi:dihydroflavonol-4-reductase
VTGATGLVGNNVVRQLLDRGEAVRILVRESSDCRTFEDLDVDVIFGDTRHANAVRAAAEGVDLIVHAAAIVKIGRTRLEQFRAVNVEGTRHVAQAAQDVGARMVHVSSTDTVGVKSLDEPADEETPFDKRIKTPYLVTKYEAEQVVLQHVELGLDAVIVNPSFMLGPWDWKPSSGEMLLAVARGRSWLAPRGYFSVVDVRDVGQGILAAAERGKPGRRYILAGKTMSYLEAWRLFAEVTGGRRPLFRTGPIVSLCTGWVGDIIGLLTGDEPSFNSGSIRIANMPRNYSSRRAEIELGYTTRPVRETVEDAWRWFQTHGYVGAKSGQPLDVKTKPAGSSAPGLPASSESHSPYPAERTPY